ncbi:molybdopterin cofactor-binding domain-containing protein, partial [Acinetobacter baumannii]
MGTYGSRSLVVGGAALSKASDKVILKARRIAAHLLEAAEQDVVFENGKASVAGTDRAKTFAEIAGAADHTGWCPIDPVSFASKLVPNIHVIGDAAIAGGIPKSASAAA